MTPATGTSCSIHICPWTLILSSCALPEEGNVWDTFPDCVLPFPQPRVCLCGGDGLNPNPLLLTAPQGATWDFQTCFSLGWKRPEGFLSYHGEMCKWMDVGFMWPISIWELTKSQAGSCVKKFLVIYRTGRDYFSLSCFSLDVFFHSTENEYVWGRTWGRIGKLPKGGRYIVHFQLFAQNTAMYKHDYTSTVFISQK